MDVAYRRTQRSEKGQRFFRALIGIGLEAEAEIGDRAEVCKEALGAFLGVAERIAVGFEGEVHAALGQSGGQVAQPVCGALPTGFVGVGAGEAAGEDFEGGGAQDLQLAHGELPWHSHAEQPGRAEQPVSTMWALVHAHRLGGTTLRQLLVT